MQQIPSFLPDLCALLWPTQCVGCGYADRSCCAHCVATIRAEVSEWARRAPYAPFEVFAAPCEVGLPYSGSVRSLLIHLKHAGGLRFAPLLGDILAVVLWRLWYRACLSDVVKTPILALPMPSRARTLRRRGYHHGELLLTHALRVLRAETGLTVILPGKQVLRAGRNRRSQAELRAGARERNAAQLHVAPGWQQRIAGSHVILIDDIVTTGATLRAASTVVVNAGAHVLGAAVICGVVRSDTARDNPENLLVSGENLR